MYYLVEKEMKYSQDTQPHESSKNTRILQRKEISSGQQIQWNYYDKVMLHPVEFGL
jgi:hypothetical protein